MSLTFPSLDFFRALQQRTKDQAAEFEKLGYCDTTFGGRVPIGEGSATAQLDKFPNLVVGPRG